MNKRVLRNTAADGTEEWWHTDGVYIMIEYVQPTDAIIAENKQKEASFNRSGKRGNLVHQAELPAHLYWDLYSKGIIEDREAFKRFLNDPDNKYLRTNNMKV